MIMDKNVERLDEEIVNLKNKMKEVESQPLDSEKLIEVIYNQNEDKLKSNFEILKDKTIKKIKEIRELARSSVKMNIVWGTLSGVIPVGDIFIQSWLKKNAKKIIAKHFADELIDFDITDNIKNTSANSEKKELEEVKEKTSDIAGDIGKTIGRGATIGLNLIPKLVVGAASVGLAGIGLGIGAGMGFYQMKTDVDAYIDFYSKRFLFRILVNLSFNDVEKYLSSEDFE